MKILKQFLIIISLMQFQSAIVATELQKQSQEEKLNKSRFQKIYTELKSRAKTLSGPVLLLLTALALHKFNQMDNAKIDADLAKQKTNIAALQKANAEEEAKIRKNLSDQYGIEVQPGESPWSAISRGMLKP